MLQVFGIQGFAAGIERGGYQFFCYPAFFSTGFIEQVNDDVVSMKLSTFIHFIPGEPASPCE
jgi:hypothetical protein